MKKKIYIVTFWHEINYGALLQMHSLFNYLKKKYDVKILRYINLKHFFLSNITSIFSNFKVYLNLKKILIFWKYNSKLNYSKFYFNLKNLTFNNVIFGSDEIWNLNHSFNKKNFNYFGQNIVSKNKNSYAASFGNLKKKNLLTREILNLKNSLQDFNIKTVRDYPSKDILKSIGIKSTLVVDPIFFIKKKKNYNKKLIIVYGRIDKDIKINKIITDKQFKNHEILSLGYENKWCNNSIIDCKIEMFLKYFRDSDLIITNMLHGELLAIKFHKKLFKINNPKKKQKSKHIFYHDLKNIKNNLNIIETSKIKKKVNLKISESKKILDTFFL